MKDDNEECIQHAASVVVVSRNGSESSSCGSLCATSVSSHDDGSSSDFFSTSKKVDTAPVQPRKSFTEESSSSNNNKKPNKNLFSMIDHMLVRHDRSMMKQQQRDVVDDDESDDDNDDNQSCTSIASYHSLNFGDDGRKMGFMYNGDDSYSDCDTLSTTSSDNSSLSSSSDEEDEDDDDESCSDYFDEADVGYPLVVENEDAATNAPREEVCNDDTSYVSETERVEGYNDEGKEDDDDDCSISTYGSHSTSAANSLVVDLKRVASTESLRRKMMIHEEPPRQPQRLKPPKKRVHFNENARVKTIRHLNDMSEKEIRRIYINSQEASEIRMSCLELVQRMEEREVLADMDFNVRNGDFDNDDNDCTRGLEKHTAINNEELIQKRKQLYASVFKIQAFRIPGGFMDVEGTIAEICTKLTQESVIKALKYGASDAKQARY